MHLLFSDERQVKQEENEKKKATAGSGEKSNSAHKGTFTGGKAEVKDEATAKDTSSDTRSSPSVPQETTTETSTSLSVGLSNSIGNGNGRAMKGQVSKEN